MHISLWHSLELLFLLLVAQESNQIKESYTDKGTVFIVFITHFNHEKFYDGYCFLQIVNFSQTLLLSHLIFELTLS